MANIHQQKLLSNIASLMSDDRDTDLKIQCEDRVWNVHKAIVSKASIILESASHGLMQESQNGIVTLNDFDAMTVERMISYKYSLDYVVEGQDDVSMEPADGTEHVDVEISNHNPSNNSQILVAHCEMFGIGDFLQMELLKTLAVEKFVNAAKKGWQAEGFIDAVKAVNKRHGMVDRRLQGALHDYAVQHCAELVKDTSLMTELLELETGRDLATDMFRQVVQQHSRETVFYEEQIQTKVDEIARQNDEIARQNDQVIQLQADSLRLQGSSMQTVQPLMRESTTLLT